MIGRLALAAWFSVALISTGIGQQVDSAAPRVHVKVYAKEPGLTPPELLPLTLPPLQIDKCRKKIDGTIELSLLVNKDGVARNIMFVHPAGNDADDFALMIAAADQFKPGTLDGKPVVTAASLKVKIQSCVVEERMDNGTPRHTAKLRANPIQEIRGPIDPPSEAVLTSGTTDWDRFVKDHPRIDASKKVAGDPGKSASAGSVPKVQAPIPIFQPDATFTEYARKKKINVNCLITLIVDEHGLPQIPEIEKSLDPGLDINSLYAVSRYRFKPAMRDGEPVPVWVAIEVNFKIW